MGINVLEFLGDDDNGCVLEDNTTDTVFGFKFDAARAVVEQFLKWLPEDARYYTQSLRHKYNEFRDAYWCSGCEKQVAIFPDGEYMTADLEFCVECEKFHCNQHEGEPWSDGETKYGHDC